MTLEKFFMGNRKKIDQKCVGCQFLDNSKPEEGNIYYIDSDKIKEQQKIIKEAASLLREITYKSHICDEKLQKKIDVFVKENLTKSW